MRQGSLRDAESSVVQKVLNVIPNGPSVVSTYRPQLIRGGDYQGDAHFDAIVIGTGAGGAAAGKVLAEKGMRVCFVEAGGGYHMPDFQQKSLGWSTRNMYLNAGVQVAEGSKPILIPAGQVVGGSTVLNSGICFRPPEERLSEWATQTGMTAFTGHIFGQYVESAWTMLGVGATTADIGRESNLIFQRGAERLGIEHHWMDRNAPGCIGCGVCHLGCPSGGKASVDKSLLPYALHRGAIILTHARVQTIHIEGGIAKGVIAHTTDANGVERDINLSADHIIVAGSALSSPRLLSQSGIDLSHNGAHLAIHPAVPVVAEFDETVMMWNGVPQGYWGHDAALKDVLFETANIGPGELYMLFGHVGDPMIYNRFSKWAMAGAMIRDNGDGRVTERIDGSRGLQYELTSADIEKLKGGLLRLVDIYEAAGAKRFAPMIRPLRFYDSAEEARRAILTVKSATDFAHMHASHPHGTCRIGQSAETGVVDAYGRVFGASGLYVMDGSIFPSTLGVNPQVTIVALSSYLASLIEAV